MKYEYRVLQVTVVNDFGGENRSTWRKTCSIATLPTTNPTQIMVPCSSDTNLLHFLSSSSVKETVSVVKIISWMTSLFTWRACIRAQDNPL